MNDDLAALFAFNRWANDRVLAACRGLSAEAFTRELPGGMSSLRATLAHLALATQTWVRRLAGETITVQNPEVDLPTFDDAARALIQADEALQQFVPTLTTSRLSSLFTYRNLKNEEKRTPFWAVLRHIVNHASYHRGQIAVKLKRLGIDAPGTDLVLWAIEQTTRGL